MKKLLLITLIATFSLTGCSITVGDSSPTSQNQAPAANNQQPNNSQATNNQATNNNQAPANNQNANPVSDIGQEKTVGKWTIQVNGVREYPGDDTSHPQNGKYIIIDAAVTNNSDQTDALGSSDVTLTDATGRKFEATYNPHGVTDLNFTTTTLPANSKAPRGVFVFDASPNGPYTLTIAQYGDTPVTWTIQP